MRRERARNRAIGLIEAWRHCLRAAVAWPVALAVSAAAQEAPRDCRGVDFNVRHPVAVAKIIADRAQVHFVKNGGDDAACPAAGDACRRDAYVVPGDLVLIGKTYGAFTCVSYQSAQNPKPSWTNGWLPASSMTPVAPARAPSRSDWIGDWSHGGGKIGIKPGRRGALLIRGEAFYAAAQNVHTGVVHATAKPAHGLLEFADDGSAPFDQTSDDKGLCLVRMQRVERLLVVEDNNACGGVMVTFTGFYRRK
ncbi:MAG TPA: hypothetical protein VEK75_14890 [Xanthobacteraceae bacterium]|nr:hypothetical protein [Xanthobacteraceae bacterium]